MFLLKDRASLKKLLVEVEKVNPAMGDFKELAMLLTLPDEQFVLIAPIFLDELEKSFNNIDDKLFIAQAMNAAGTKVEDMQQAYAQLIDAIDKQFGDFLTAPKKDFLKRMLAISYNSVADVQGVTKRIV